MIGRRGRAAGGSGPAGSAGTVAVLRRIFFRRFFDNDLVAPGGSGYEAFGLVFAFLAVPGLLSVAPMLLVYMNRFIPPGGRLLRALDDKFSCLALSMIVMALVTVIEWDALALDRRDVAILGPFPIEPRVLRRAKLESLALFLAAFAAAVNLVPSVLYPLVLFGAMKIGAALGVWLILVHAGVSLAAGAFAFFTIVALRQAIRLATGDRLFRAASVVVQALLVVGLVSGLLLLPGHASVSRSMLGGGGRAEAWNPPLWFLGLYESLTGRAVLESAPIELPRSVPRRAADGSMVQEPTGAPDFMIREAADSRAAYLQELPRFNRLAGVALGSLAASAVLAFAGYAAGARRPARRVGGSRRALPGWLRRGVERAAERTVVRDPVARATFFFTLQALARGTGQRLYLAGFAAVALAALVVLVPVADLRAALGPARVPTAPLLAVQMVLVFCLVAGLRFVFTVPAELRAAWVFRAGWLETPGRYLSGVRRAGFLVASAPLVALFPVHWLAWGAEVALAHLALGAMSAALLVETAFLGLRTVPFTSPYEPRGTLKFLWPFYVLAFLAFTRGFGWVEAWALEVPARAGWFAAVLGAAALALAARRAWGDRHRVGIPFDDPAEPATQRLGVAGVD